MVYLLLTTSYKEKMKDSFIEGVFGRGMQTDEKAFLEKRVDFIFWFELIFIVQIPMLAYNNLID